MKRKVAKVCLILFSMVVIFLPITIINHYKTESEIKQSLPQKIEQSKEIQADDEKKLIQHELQQEEKIKEYKKQITKIKSHNEEIKEQGKEILFTISFYTSLPEENGGYANLNCLGQHLQYGMVANNYWKLGREIYLPEFDNLQTFKVADHGGKDFYCCNRIDIFVPQRNGESKEEYKHRVWNMGIKQVRGYIK